MHVVDATLTAASAEPQLAASIISIAIPEARRLFSVPIHNLDFKMAWMSSGVNLKEALPNTCPCPLFSNSLPLHVLQRFTLSVAAGVGCTSEAVRSR